MERVLGQGLERVGGWGWGWGMDGSARAIGDGDAGWGNGLEGNSDWKVLAARLGELLCPKMKNEEDNQSVQESLVQVVLLGFK